MGQLVAVYAHYSTTLITDFAPCGVRRPLNLAQGIHSSTHQQPTQTEQNKRFYEASDTNKAGWLLVLIIIININEYQKHILIFSLKNNYHHFSNIQIFKQ